jgi:hypothetical protein
MPDLFGQALWPGVNSFIDAQYTCGWGISPGTATLTIGPQLNAVAEVGDLTLTDGQNSVVVPSCKVVQPGYDVGPQGQQVRLLIEDRRWQWRGLGTLSGRYNVLDERTATVPPLAQPLAPPVNQPGPPPAPPPGAEPIKPWSRKTAPELAALCLEAMGETDYDVSALDPKATPAIHWDAVNPAAALDQLANDLGCVVVYRPDTDSVVLCKRGEGRELPGGLFLRDAPSLDVKARPPAVVCLGAETLYQVRFALEAVGIDFDGTIKPIDKLSYRPFDGWGRCWPPGFAPLVDPRSVALLPAGYRAQDALRLARESVYRTYRVRVTGPGIEGDFKIPPGGAGRQIVVKRREQILLTQLRNLLVTDDTGRQATAPAVCYGRYAVWPAFKQGDKLIASYAQTDNQTQVHIPFDVDAAHQLIKFERAVFSINDDAEESDDDDAVLIEPAKIVLETAARVADPDTMQYVRYARQRSLGPAGQDVEPAYVVREDVQYKVTAVYGDDNKFLRRETNKLSVQRRADYYLAGEVRHYQSVPAGDRTYPGVLPVFPDGAVMQVTWAVGGGNAQNPQTRASRNAEHATYLPAYEARRRIEAGTIDQQRRDREAALAAGQKLDDLKFRAVPVGG